MATVLVDAENVRRSLWPNIGRDELVARVAGWAAREGHAAVVVFEGARSADDEIVALAGRTSGAVWVATSDRELRGRLAGRAERIIGGGAFARML